MDSKQIAIAIIVLLSVLLIVIASFFGVYKFYPQLIGLEPKQKKESTVKKPIIPIKRDTIPPVPAVNITEQRLKELEADAAAKVLLLNQKDSINKVVLANVDTVNKVMNLRKSYADSIQNVLKSKEDVKKFSNKLMDSIQKLTTDLAKSQQKADNALKRLKDSEDFIAQKEDSLEKKNFITYAKIYNNAAPKEVARILEQIDERDASKILKMMSPKKASKVLEAMKPEHAAAILLLGTSN